jgi:hypothetical protein
MGSWTKKPCKKSRVLMQVEARLTRQNPRTMREALAPKAAAVQAIGDAAMLYPVASTVGFSSVSSIAGAPRQTCQPLQKYLMVEIYVL